MSEKWYGNGLKFECTQCGHCCTGAPGYVWVSLPEIYRIAEFLQMDDYEFTQEIRKESSSKVQLNRKAKW